MRSIGSRRLPRITNNAQLIRSSKKRPGKFASKRKTSSNGDPSLTNTVFSSTVLRREIPGRQGGGGILMDPEGLMEISYSWGLRIETNNREEALTMLQGIRQEISSNVQNLVVFGDSRLLIQAIQTRKLPNQVNLNQVLRKIELLLYKFNSIHFFCVLRGLNAQVYLEANKGSLQGRGVLTINGTVTHSQVP
jgi:hypothetical protein